MADIWLFHSSVVSYSYRRERETVVDRERKGQRRVRLRFGLFG